MEAFIEVPLMKRRKENAVREMLAELEKERAEKKKEPFHPYGDQEDYYTSDESDPEADRQQDLREQKIDGEFDLIKRFILALPTCLLLTVGFDVSVSGQADVNEQCFCPCGDKMQKWRELTKCEFMEDDGGCGSNSKSKQGRFDNPNRLVAHIREKSHLSTTYKLHGRVLKYLEKVYSNYWPNSGLSHKGLYIEGDGNYVAAEKEEKRKNEE